MTAARASVRREVRIKCNPDVAWEWVGDPARLPQWWPGITSCTVVGVATSVSVTSEVTSPVAGSMTPVWVRDCANSSTNSAKLTAQNGWRHHGSCAVGGVATSVRLDGDTEPGPICVTEHQHDLLALLAKIGAGPPGRSVQRHQSCVESRFKDSPPAGFFAGTRGPLVFARKRIVLPWGVVTE